MIHVNSLWIGNRLSNLELTAIKSHIKVGHTYHLWCYEEIENVPDEVIVEDGERILSGEEIWCYQVGAEKGSYSAFSNLFRYSLLMERDGWWVDTDVVALKPFDFDDYCVFASERCKDWSVVPTTCVIKCPKGLAEECFNFSYHQNRSILRWGTIGPKLLGRVIDNWPLDMLSKYVQPPETFCPTNWFDAEYDPVIHNPPDLSKSYAVHMWHEMWRRAGIDKDAEFEKDCLYERLKRLYLYPHSEECREEHSPSLKLL